METFEQYSDSRSITKKLLKEGSDSAKLQTLPEDNLRLKDFHTEIERSINEVLDKMEKNELFNKIDFNKENDRKYLQEKFRYTQVKLWQESGAMTRGEHYPHYVTILNTVGQKPKELDQKIEFHYKGLVNSESLSSKAKAEDKEIYIHALKKTLHFLAEDHARAKGQFKFKENVIEGKSNDHVDAMISSSKTEDTAPETAKAPSRLYPLLTEIISDDNQEICIKNNNSYPRDTASVNANAICNPASTYVPLQLETVRDNKEATKESGRAPHIALEPTLKTEYLSNKIDKDFLKKIKTALDYILREKGKPIDFKNMKKQDVEKIIGFLFDNHMQWFQEKNYQIELDKTFVNKKYLEFFNNFFKNKTKKEEIIRLISGYLDERCENIINKKNIKNGLSVSILNAFIKERDECPIRKKSIDVNHERTRIITNKKTYPNEIITASSTVTQIASPNLLSRLTNAIRTFFRNIADFFKRILLIKPKQLIPQTCVEKKRSYSKFYSEQKNSVTPENLKIGEISAPFNLK